MQTSLDLEPQSQLKKPRDYQETILTSLDKGWKEFRKQLVIAATGAGKTHLFCWMVGKEHANNLRSLILVDQRNLIRQTAKKLKDSTGIHAEIESGESRASRHAPVVIATVQSMVQRLDRWPQDHFSLVIADEADKSLADTWQKSLQHFDRFARVAGFTATPWRSDSRDMGEYYENIAADVPLRELIVKGWLSKLCIQQVPLKIDTSGLGRGGKDYTLEDADHAITPYLGSVIDAMLQYGPERKTLVFVPLIRTSELFVSMCRDRGLAAEHIDGESDNQDEIRDRFENGETHILVNSMLLTRGVDIPAISRIIPLRLTKSVSLYHQMVGRGTRLFTGKSDLMLFDFLYQAENMLICRPAHLLAKTEEEAQSITEVLEAKAGGEGQDLLEAEKSASSAREEALAKKLAALANRKAKFISAEEFAIQHHQLEIAEFQPTMKWHADKLTPKQAEWIEKAGVDPESVRGKGHASAILDVYFKEKGKEPATSGQRWRMRQAGWVSKDGKRSAFQATRDDAKEFFASLGRVTKPKSTGNAWE